MKIEGEVRNTTSAIVTGTLEEFNLLGSAIIEKDPSIPDWLTIDVVAKSSDHVRLRLSFEWADAEDRSYKMGKVRSVMNYFAEEGRVCNVY